MNDIKGNQIHEEYDGKTSIFNATQIKQSYYSQSSHNESQFLKLPRVEVETITAKIEDQKKEKE